MLTNGVVNMLKLKKKVINVFLAGTNCVNKHQLSECIRGIDYSFNSDSDAYIYYGSLQTYNGELAVHIWSSKIIQKVMQSPSGINEGIIALCISRNQDLQQEIDALDLSVLDGIDFSKTKICLMVVTGNDTPELTTFWSLKNAKDKLNQRLQERDIPLINDNGCFWVSIDESGIGNNSQNIFLSYVKMQIAKDHIKAELTAYRSHVAGHMWYDHCGKRSDLVASLDELISQVDKLNNTSDFEHFKQSLIAKKEECFGHHEPRGVSCFKTAMMWISTIIFVPIAMAYLFFGRPEMYRHSPRGALVYNEIDKDTQDVINPSQVLC